MLCTAGVVPSIERTTWISLYLGLAVAPKTLSAVLGGKQRRCQAQPKLLHGVAVDRGPLCGTTAVEYRSNTRPRLLSHEAKSAHILFSYQWCVPLTH